MCRSNLPVEEAMPKIRIWPAWAGKGGSMGFPSIQRNLWQLHGFKRRVGASEPQLTHVLWNHSLTLNKLWLRPFLKKWGDRSTWRKFGGWGWITAKKNMDSTGFTGSWFYRLTSSLILWFIRSLFHWITDSLIHWFSDLLIRWFTDSLRRWILVKLLTHCFLNSMIFTDSLIGWLFGSLIHWFIIVMHWFIDCWFTDSLLHWFIESLNPWVIDSLIHWLNDHLLIDALIHWMIFSSTDYVTPSLIN